MAVIEPVEESGAPAASTSRASLPRPPPRSGDFTYAQPTDAPRNLDETLKAWDSVPLFMKDLPSDSTDETSAAALEALQSLAFDGTPDEVAANFKSQAADYFKSKRYREAAGFYTQGIEAKPQDKALLETLYANRAACNLELGNYGSVLKDTKEVLGLNAKNEKAWYRATKALLALDRAEEALECAEHGVGVNPENQAMKAIRDKAHERLTKLKQAADEKKERQRREEGMKQALQQALIVRGLWLETTPRPPDNPQPAHFDVDSLAGSSSLSLPLLGATRWTPPDVIRTPLVLPVFLIYPQHAQSDFIADFHEDTPLSDYLQTIFPASARGSLPWDTQREYYDANLQVYATTRKQRLLKLGRKLTLRQVIDQAFQEAQPGEDKVKDRDGLVMRDGILSLVVLPKGDPETAWVEQFKAERDKTAKAN